MFLPTLKNSRAGNCVWVSDATGRIRFFEDDNEDDYDPIEDEDDYRRNREGEPKFAFLGQVELKDSGLKVELIDVIFGEDRRRAEEDLAAVDNLEFA